ncbi:aldehyde dehydrogenase family protein [Pseudomonas sp.]|uniref:aldehyde dehydrogenase family protein n=1 Tax=Pseudomonas sp. TaxID=306 RepID=UPI0026DC2A2B|nr:aldehyde dehydrogenase family protein [Pseudomonas sp.]MDO4234187.1 aldehyde dehydrogenase family protein [Pseudomonas sp.]
MTDQAIKDLKIYHPYINGKSWQSDDQPEQVVINPYTQQAIARVKLATAADIDSAIASAFEAQKVWGKTLAKEREAILCRAADIIERRRGDIVKILIEEGGNVFGKAMFECDYMVSTFRIAAGQARDIRGETMPADGAGRISMSIRQPLGVIAGVGPFNAPLLLNGKKLAPRLGRRQRIPHEAGPANPADWFALR